MEQLANTFWVHLRAWRVTVPDSLCQSGRCLLITGRDTSLRSPRALSCGMLRRFESTRELCRIKVVHQREHPCAQYSCRPI